MVEDSTQASEASQEVNETTGKTEVSPDDFLTDEEKTSEEAPAEEQTAEGETQTEETEAKQEEGEKEEAPLLGKFKTEADLRQAFANLGGNPDEYQDVSALAEAYRVREREFSRVRQQIAELEKSNLEEQGQDKQAGADDDMINQVADQIDWSKVQDARDLFAQTLKVVDQLYRYRSQQERQELVQQIAAEIEQRERAAQELASVEAEVPRLKSDPVFRDAFAQFVAGQKQLGKFQNLKASMKDFLALGQKIAEETAKVKAGEESQKQSAQMPESKAEGQTSSKKDEVDAIVDAYLARKNLFK